MTRYHLDYVVCPLGINKFCMSIHFVFRIIDRIVGSLAIGELNLRYNRLPDLCWNEDQFLSPSYSICAD